MDDIKRFVYNDWMTTSDKFQDRNTEFSLSISYPDCNTFPSLKYLKDAVNELWERNRRDFYCPLSPWDADLLIAEKTEEQVTPEGGRFIISKNTRA